MGFVAPDVCDAVDLHDHMRDMAESVSEVALVVWPSGGPLGVAATSDLVGLAVVAVIAPVGYAMWRLLRR